MELTFLGTSAGLPTKERNTQSIAFNCLPYENQIWLFDVGEATQHRVLHTGIKLGKVSHIFITHLHGDHIFGLPGLLTSRSFQGGKDKPLTIIGPKGIAKFIETALEISQSNLNYQMTINEFDTEINLNINGFHVQALPLKHGILSVGYRIEAPDIEGKLDVAKLKALGMEPGPLYQKVKADETFEYNGQIYQSKNFKGSKQKGKVITIFGDTMICENQAILAHNADLIVHETTYIEGDKQLANSYHHSHIDDVLQLMKNANVKKGLFTHLSNRYELEEVNEIEHDIQQTTTQDIKFVKDYDNFQI
ncbi:ribonuclease Z [Mammaliicoccus stepanovicii]|uniref:Ribonuclease Z n=1 Tax=Mammaliicoccus stepanovicii TaxID=643214 RepID=A0A239Z7W3_9STAP|nr:ribonuclease Z [Mammaliicoccus stepanovicii]PNZ72702.1 ribonuclease Z [Mammaliicoccus stepanovicii]GGI39920.1 ribonuclease Z [Mammaliicoccus stepanovicii]SNV67057.1 ribonuclease Z [Mammaliicoccus stepanovicii]